MPISAGHFSVDVVTSKCKAPIWAGHFSIDVVTSKYEAPIWAGHFSIHVVNSKYKVCGEFPRELRVCVHRVTVYL